MLQKIFIQEFGGHRFSRSGRAGFWQRRGSIATTGVTTAAASLSLSPDTPPQHPEVADRPADAAGLLLPCGGNRSLSTMANENDK
jgi:hypothetical protein